jgi:hypothetical protein
MAETVSETLDLFLRFSQETSDVILHAPSLLHISEAAYFV